MNKIIIAGGSGHLGTLLTSFYKDKVNEIVILSRNKQAANGNIRTAQWDGKHAGSWINELEGADMLINLTGKNVNCRYNSKNKQAILESRIDSVKILGKGIQQCKNPLRVWVQSASATIYRHAEDRGMDENTGELGQGFSVDVCKQWEQTFWDMNVPSTRKVLLRIGIVLGQGGGAFPRMLNLAKAGLGGYQGNGDQFISWIHEADVVHSIDWLYKHNNLEGTFNITSPHPIRNKDFMRILRKVLGISIGLPSPAWLLEMGAWLIGTETELILKSRWVLPARLQQTGYVFHYPSVESAFHSFLKPSSYGNHTS